jgi:mono/diheme cytochrome c family protein
MSGKRALRAGIVVAMALAPAAAQEAGQAGRGLELANRLCAQCHNVLKTRVPSPNERAPRFETIASVPGMTTLALSAALNTSHRTMPNIMLEREDQASIIAYILSLK